MSRRELGMLEPDRVLEGSPVGVDAGGPSRLADYSVGWETAGALESSDSFLGFPAEAAVDAAVEHARPA